MKTLNDFFDNIYCINLPKSTDRLEEVNKEFIKHSIIVEKFDAVDGTPFFKPGLNRSAGHHGLILTNIKVFEDAIAKGYKKILIIEDDIYFVENVNEKFGKKIDYLPNDWNMLYLGGNSQFTWARFDMITGNPMIPINKSTYNSFDYELVRTRHTQSTFAIGYNSNIFHDFLNRMRGYTEPLDVLQPALQKELYKTFIFLPTLVKHKDGFSIVFNSIQNYNQAPANNF